MTATPPRLHVLIARHAPRAVVIRRGPSRFACTLAWDLATDTFSLGQWVRARLYERRCDLSPDGRHLIYFALNGRWESETRGAWTAISRAPYLKALTLYAKGDAWNGGGVFRDNKSYLLNGVHEKPLLDHSGLSCVGGAPPPGPYGNNECLGVYYPRLLRDGWRMNDDLSHQRIQVFEKAWTGGVSLRKYCHVGKGPRPGGVYTDSHALVRSSEVIAEFPFWEWAEVIGERLAWAQAGVISAAPAAASLDPTKLMSGAHQLYCFNAMHFERVKAPY